jgi:hypothetical protein
MSYWTFSLCVEVSEPREVHEAAMRRAVADGMSRRDAYSLLGTKRQPDMAACLQMLFDPGVSPDGCKIISGDAQRDDD